MPKKMLINASFEGERRLAIVDGPELLELFIERESLGHQVGDIFLAKVVNIEPSIQAAFLDYGAPKNGFLHISDVVPNCYANKPKNSGGRDRPPIQQVLHKGQQLVVQMLKTPIGNKGAAMTTYISLAGRYLVLMPGISRRGVSRKIEDSAQRKELKKAIEGAAPDDGMGYIVRTAAMGRTKRELQADISYLNRLWKNIKDKAKGSKAPMVLLEESDLAIRGIRDFYTSDIDEIVTDSPEARDRINEFMQIIPSRQRPKLTLHEGHSALFDKYQVEEEIRKMFSRKVDLPRGGHIVIDQAEALVAIDVNTGGFRGSNDPEENLFQLNMIAAKEIARQIRLRDLGGVLVVDFIDMRDSKNIRKVEKAFADEFKKDKARTKMLKISSLGILQMTRQRMRPSLNLSVYRNCPYCEGTGFVKNCETVALEFFRRLRSLQGHVGSETITVHVHPEVAAYLLNDRRRELSQLEDGGVEQVIVVPDPNVHPETIQFQNIPKSKIEKAERGELGGGGGGSSRRDSGRDQKSETRGSERQRTTSDSGDDSGDQDKPKKKRRRRGGRRRRKKTSDGQQDNQSGSQKDQSKQDKDDSGNKQQDQKKQDDSTDKQQDQKQKQDDSPDKQQDKQKQQDRRGRDDRTRQDQKQQQQKQQGKSSDKKDDRRDRGGKDERDGGKPSSDSRRDTGRDDRGKGKPDEKKPEPQKPAGTQPEKPKAAEPQMTRPSFDISGIFDEDKDTKAEQKTAASSKDESTSPEKSTDETSDKSTPDDKDKKDDDSGKTKKKKTRRRRKSTKKKTTKTDDDKDDKDSGKTKTTKKKKSTRKKSTRKKSTKKKTTKKDDDKDTETKSD